MLTEEEIRTAMGTSAGTAEATSPGGSNAAGDETFSPNLINTAIFLVTSTIQVNNFAINYYGHPYMQSFSENVMLHRAVFCIYVVLLILVGGQFEPFNDLFELVGFSSMTYAGNDTLPLGVITVAPEFQGYLLTIMVSSGVLGVAVEYLSRKLESVDK